MGRILDALSQAETKRTCPPEPALTLHAASILPEPAGEEEADEAMPFIEVGGPRRIIAASPEVLAAVPPAPRPFPAARPASGPGPGWKSVVFRPLSPGQLPLPPAHGRFAPELIAFHQPDHALSEGYRALLAGIREQLAAGRSHVLLFTAPATSAGTTTVLLNLALTAARAGEEKVVVVDANGRRPEVAQRLGLPPAPGLREVLSGTASLQQALQETGQTHLHALTAGRSGDDGVRLVTEAMPLVLRLLREQFALVVVDAPCVASGPAALALASACDAAYLVVEEARAEAPEVAETLHAIHCQGTALCGCILTQR